MAATDTPLLFDFCVRYRLGHNIGHIRSRLDPSSTDASSQLRIKHRQDVYVGNPRDTLKNQVISYVTPNTKLLPPAAICSRKRGITDPLDPRTFPNRTATNSVLGCSGGSNKTATMFQCCSLSGPLLTCGLLLFFSVIL